MGDEKITNKNTRKFVTITDMNMWSMIEDIMTVKGYKSFNKVINDALIYGLPELHKRLFDKVEIDGEEKNFEIPKGYGSEVMTFQIIRLLKECIANDLTIKSLISSMFNVSVETLKGNMVSAERFEKGSYAFTPQFIIPQEVKMLKEANKK